MSDITLPQAGDEVTATWGQSVAKAVNGIQAGSVTLSGMTSTTSQSFAIIFPKPYSSAPAVTSASSQLSVNTAITNITATGCTMVGRRNDGSGTATSAVCGWIAVGTLA